MKKQEHNEIAIGLAELYVDHKPRPTASALAYACELRTKKKISAHTLEGILRRRMGVHFSVNRAADRGETTPVYPRDYPDRLFVLNTQTPKTIRQLHGIFGCSRAAIRGRVLNLVARGTLLELRNKQKTEHSDRVSRTNVPLYLATEVAERKKK